VVDFKWRGHDKPFSLEMAHTLFRGTMHHASESGSHCRSSSPVSGNDIHDAAVADPPNRRSPFYSTRRLLKNWAVIWEKQSRPVSLGRKCRLVWLTMVRLSSSLIQSCAS